jgi:anti-anti-sigma factor
MKISTRTERSVPVVSLEGRFDARGASEFDEAWHTLPAAASHVVIDLTEVGYLSSLGIRSLLTAEKALRQRHGGTVLAGLTPFVSNVLKTAGLLGQIQHTTTVEEAVDIAATGTAAEGASAEHTVHGRRYRVVPDAKARCVFEVWGDFAAPPELSSAGAALDRAEGPAIDVTLDELGLAVGVGGFGKTGSQSADSMGKFVAAGKFAGVLPTHGLADFVLSDHPDEVDVAVSAAIGFAGAPAFRVEMLAPAPVALAQVLEDVRGLLPAAPVIGFTAQTETRLAAGLYSSGKLHGSAIVFASSPSLNPRLEDLKGVEDAAETLVQNASIAIYVPHAARLGTDKRLKIESEAGGAIEEEWRQIISRLYRDCSRVILTPLTGGYNAKTFRVASYDKEGRRLLPTVLKIGVHEMIQREEDAHRAYVQKFILNNSTTIMGTATAGASAALRYNFLGISGPDTRLGWFFDYYRSHSTEDVLRMFHRLYTQILKPWYGQPRWVPIRLYEDHSPLRLFPNLCAHAERDFGFSPNTETIECAELGISLANPFRFLQTEYAKHANEARLWYQAINHGDLNLRNILVDELENLYVVDFSETKPRNIVSDFARMEAILKFEMLRVESSGDIARLVEFEQGLADVGSLAGVPANRYRGDDPEVAKAYAVIRKLREYANTVTIFETDIVPYWLAVLEWTYSVLSYDLQPPRRKLAAYSAAIICERMQPPANARGSG